MTIKKLNLDQTLLEFGRRLKAHLGSPGDAPLPVTIDANGFMTANQYGQFSQIFSHRKTVPVGTDILKLEPGFYVGSGFLNHPSTPTPDTETTWISSIDVSDANDGRRIYNLTDNFVGFRWYRIIHTGGDLSSGTGAWVREYGEITLWTGYSKLETPVPLSQSVLYDTKKDVFDKIKVYFQTDFGNKGVSEGTSGKVIINAMNLNDNSDIPAPDFFEAQMVFPTSTTAQLSKNKRINFYTKNDSSVAYLKADVGKINITKIVGIK